MLSCALSAAPSVLDPWSSPGQEKMVAHPRAEKEPLQHEYKQRARIPVHISLGVHLIVLFWLPFSRYLLLFKYHFLQPLRNDAALERSERNPMLGSVASVFFLPSKGVLCQQSPFFLALCPHQSPPPLPLLSFALTAASQGQNHLIDPSYPFCLPLSFQLASFWNEKIFNVRLERGDCSHVEG